MDKATKEALVADVRERLGRATATFIVDYKGLDVSSMSRLRRELRDVGAELQVIKNRLLVLASRDTDTAVMADRFKGPCAIAITYDDMVGPAKVLAETEKTSQKLEIRFGQLSGRFMDAEGIKRLAKLPGREELLAQVLAAMQAVPGSFVRVLSGVTVSFLNVLKALEDKKRAEA